MFVNSVFRVRARALLMLWVSSSNYAIRRDVAAVLIQAGDLVQGCNELKKLPDTEGSRYPVLRTAPNNTPAELHGRSAFQDDAPVSHLGGT